jgi:hypothetical protein
MRCVKRKFPFDIPAGLFPVVVERLRGTPARLEERVRVIDMAYFVAEHDDHHLALMTRLAKKFG